MTVRRVLIDMDLPSLVSTLVRAEARALGSGYCRTAGRGLTRTIPPCYDGPAALGVGGKPRTPSLFAARLGGRAVPGETSHHVKDEPPAAN